MCRGGARSVPFIAILNKYGYKNLTHIIGGFLEVSKSTKLPVSYKECTMKKTK